MNRNMLRYGRIFIMGLMLCWVSVNMPMTVHAQESSGLCYGWYSLDPNNESVVSGEITNNGPSENWIFEGNAGSFVTIRMQVTSGNLDPFAYINDNSSNARIITSAATKSDETPEIRIANLQLPSEGTYTITMTRLGEQNGNTTGSYSLSLEPGLENVFVASELSANLDAMIYDGEVVTGQVPVAFQFDAWYFEGQRGDRITAVVRSMDGSSLIGDLTLLAFREGEWVEQTIVSVDGDSELRLDNFALSTSGLYVLRVRPTFTPFSNYELTLGGSGGIRPELPRCKTVVAQCPAQSPLGAPALDIFDKTPAFGNVTAVSPAIAYGFDAFEGDVISVTMERTGGDLDTFLGLANERGNVLARDSGFDPARSAINSFTIPVDGCYFVYASREGVGDGTTEGTFIVTATGIPAGETTDVPQAPVDIAFGRDIAPGETAMGTVADDRVQVAYRFRAETSGTYSAIATRSSGNLAPGLILYDAQFAQLDAVTANFVGNASNPLTFEAEAGAYYFIVVQREGGAGGTSIGDFTLSVVPS